MVFEIIQKSRYLQNIGNAYIFQFQCMRCFAQNSGLLNKQWIDKELEDKETCVIEDICKTCKRKIKVMFSKEVKYIVKEAH